MRVWYRVRDLDAALREDDIEVGTVLELHEEVRLLDVYDHGNRVQLVQELR